jgi:ribonuclease BN (tRNA processing enzyme)
VKLTVLGGSAAGPNTGAGCSGYLVDSGRTRLVLDLGPGTLPELRRHTDFRTLDGIVISHMHLDHILDVAALRFALAYNPVKPHGLLPLWLPPGGCAQLGRLGPALVDDGEGSEFFSSVFDLREYEPDSVLPIGDVLITFAPTVHYVPCWAMRLHSMGYSDLGYTADTGPAAPLASFFAGVIVLISEATLTVPDEDPPHRRGHLTAREAALLADEADAKTLVISHIWEELGFERLRADAAAVFHGHVLVAHPGAVVEW